MSFWRERADGVDLYVRATPGARREGLNGLFQDASGQARLSASLRAVAENGKANDALVALIAAALRVPRSSIRLTAGASARLKTLRVEGDPGQLARQAATLAKPSG